jgi:hypothetical protein
MLTSNPTLNKVILGVSIPILLTLLTFSFNAVCSHVALNWETAALASSNAVTLESHIQSEKNLPQQIEQLQSTINDIYRDMNTIQGVAKVGNFGRDEGYIQVNISGRASKYVKEVKAKVTNITNETHPSYVLPIKGTYSDPNPECIIRVSEKAARDMYEVNNGQFRVQIELHR